MGPRKEAKRRLFAQPPNWTLEVHSIAAHMLFSNDGCYFEVMTLKVDQTVKVNLDPWSLLFYLISHP